MQINVLDYLENSALQFPDKPALVDENNIVSFSELENWAKAIGSTIVNETSSSIRKPIIVLVDRKASSIVSFMGVLYSGNHYVPIDIETPNQRLRIIIEDLNSLAIICAKKDIGVLDGLENLPKCLIFEEIIENPINEKNLKKIRDTIIDVDPIYTIFTSGSTGKPKGIVVSHKNVIDLAEWLDYTFKFSSDEILGNQTPFYFDASVKDIYICLKKGITMFIIPKKLFMFPLLLIDYLNENKITTILWTTSAIVLVANSKVLDTKIPIYLKKIFFAGEPMFAKHLNIWRTHIPEVMYVNLYGPTEITVDCTYYIVNREFSDDEAIPIGNACRNMEIILLDENYQQASRDETGEICVRGTGLALGYINEPGISKEVYIQNPLNDSYRDIIYCTGDIARYNEYGEIVFVSRKDGQIKHMGNRIELGEIELAVNSLKGIERCFCFYDSKDRKIVLEYVGTLDSKSIINRISDKLPRHMIPKVIIKQPRFLYNPNKKIDRKKMMESYFNEKD